MPGTIRVAKALCPVKKAPPHRLARSMCGVPAPAWPLLGVLTVRVIAQSGETVSGGKGRGLVPRNSRPARVDHRAIIEGGRGGIPSAPERALGSAFEKSCLGSMGSLPVNNLPS